jgi:hypothetical protein
VCCGASLWRRAVVSRRAVRSVTFRHDTGEDARGRMHAMHRACTGEDARLVCLGVSPSPRVRCLLACFTLLYFTRPPRHVSSPFESRYFVKRQLQRNLRALKNLRQLHHTVTTCCEPLVYCEPCGRHTRVRLGSAASSAHTWPPPRPTAIHDPFAQTCSRLASSCTRQKRTTASTEAASCGT